MKPKYVSMNMALALKQVCESQNGIRVEQLHVLTTAALMARGAVIMTAKTGVPGVYIKATEAGRRLSYWVNKARFIDYFEARPKVHDAKMKSAKE